MTYEGGAMASSFRRGELAGSRLPLLVQAVGCVALGAALLGPVPETAAAGVLGWVGLYWLFRCYATVMQAMFVCPREWGARGLVAVLQLSAALLVIQAPLLGLVELGGAIVLFLGFQAVVAGALELVLAARSGEQSVAFLGLVNVAMGLILIVPLLSPMMFSEVALGMTAVAGGLLSLYCLVALPMPRDRRADWTLHLPDGVDG